MISYNPISFIHYIRDGVGAMSDIVWFIRLPRILLATAVGMGLAVAGVVMQAIVKNPIADPYILGISSGRCV